MGVRGVEGGAQRRQLLEMSTGSPRRGGGVDRRPCLSCDASWGDVGGVRLGQSGEVASAWVALALRRVSPHAAQARAPARAAPVCEVQGFGGCEVQRTPGACGTVAGLPRGSWSEVAGPPWLSRSPGAMAAPTLPRPPQNPISVLPCIDLLHPCLAVSPVASVSEAASETTTQTGWRR